MDYKYIEQLLDKYWNCETSLEEEQILRCFFRQAEVPVHLLRYKSLFAYQDAARMPKLGEDFDERVLAEIERPVVKAKRLTWRMRMMPLFKAAAVMAFLFTVGGVVKHSADGGRSSIIYVYDQFEHEMQDPQVAYKPDSVKAPIENVPEKDVRNKQ
ncbi:hypothetical protein Bacsa_3038 [Phocaeicola salanitronis DSM 18170]|jgi:hypothetical protein|uniref:Pyruvate ferredoxin oxidoreductase n=1 Tax=Phocaeicola salanitronis (strain DSM 18170 / JCM 13657 / CCUG 60908 / BL78) TaxID=667015 RepID=F0R2M9_PHOSB|nr:hypothetical protein [Phocaeicola salanitronis]ADY37567.1 hypothetical protein Bacsa_3038 [Phocaeicola salanitronis DSM 18170]